MSHDLVSTTTAGVDPAPNAGDAVPVEQADLTPERKDALIARARAIIAGRVRPPALVASPAVETFLQREFAGRDQPPTPEALRRIAERLTLEAQYGGRPVACFTAADGSFAVLAAGDREIEALLQGLPEAEAARVVVTDSDAS